ncbi:hypothetical protein [Roseibium sp.]|uniref:hypothetical protein n=1 Tax=Roseibium sp. TaxID=1936156 RepID=UPI003D12F577
MNVIEQIAEARAKLPEGSNGVLLAGLDGKIYNCLDEQIPLEELEKIKCWSGSLALTRANLRAEDPNEDGGYCDCAFQYSEKNHGINVCYLPYEQIDLNSANCTNRLKVYLQHLRSK